MGGRFSKRSSDQKTIDDLTQRIIDLKQSILHDQSTKLYPKCMEIHADIASITLDIRTLQTVTKRQEIRDTCDEFLHEINVCADLLRKVEDEINQSGVDATIDVDLIKLEQDVDEMEGHLNARLRSDDLKVLQELERTTQILYRKVEDLQTEPRTILNERREKVGRKLVRCNKKVRDAMEVLGAMTHLGRITWPHHSKTTTNTSNQQLIDQLLSDEFDLARSRRLQNRKSVEFSSLRTNFLESQLREGARRYYGGSMDFPSSLRRDPINRLSHSYGDKAVVIEEAPQPVRIRSSEIKKYCLSKDNIATEV